nr:hypothetical protein [Tanacetum cinerariifolium]
NGNGHVSVTTDINGVIKVLPPKTAEEVVAREKDRKARTTLLMALPKDHLEKFHKMADAKKMWEAIKSIFGGNDESKKMQKYLLKQQFEGFFMSASEGLHKRYDRFQTLLSQLEIHGAGVSHEDANQKFLSAPQLDCNDLEQINDDDLEKMDLKWQVAMISIRINKFYMRTGRKLKFDTRDTVGFDKTKVECFNCHKIGHFARDCRAKGNQDSRRRDDGYNGNNAKDNCRRPVYQDDSKALVTIDGEAIDWSGHVEEDTLNFAMMAYSSSNSGFDNVVQSCSKTCAESYARLKKLCDKQRDKLGDASIDIIAYTLALKKNVFMNKEYDLENTPVNDRYAEGMHAVLPPMTGNYIPSGPDTDAPIIEEYDLDSDDDSMSNVQENIEKPSFSFTDSVKHVKSLRENVKETGTPNHYPNIKKQNRHGHSRKGLGYAFTRKSCFVCGSFSHLIRDCDFHEKRMAKQAALTKSMEKDDPYKALKDKGIIYSGCSRHMTGNKAHLANYQEFKGGFVAFGGSNGKITGKGKIKDGRLDFKDVYYVEELKHYNLFSVSQMCDKKKKVLFTDTDCLVLSSDFKLLDENQKGKQHKASCEAKTVSSVHQPLQILHMDLFKPTSNEATPILKDFIRQDKNQFNHKVKTIRSNNGTEFKNHDLIELCGLKGIKREYSNAKTLQQNGVTERKNMTLINPARNMLADSLLPTKFWAEAVNTACYVLNRMFDLDYLTNSMSYEPVSLENQANKSTGPQKANNSAGTQAKDDQGTNSEEINLHDEDFVLPIWSAYSTTVKSLKEKIQKTTDCKTCEKLDVNTNSTNLLNVVSTPVSAVGSSRALNDDEPSYLVDPSMPYLEDIYACQNAEIFTNSSYDNEGVVTDFNNLETTVSVSPTPTTRIYTIHPKSQILGDPLSAVQTRSKVHKNSKAHALALYGLQQAPRAWYATLSTFLEKSRYRRGSINKTLFIKQDKKDIMLVQVYVNDIISSSTKKSWCDGFKELIKNRFQMSSMGELTFFLRLQVKQKEDGIFISPDKYVAEILKKFDFLSVKTVCACSRFQVTLKTSHLQAVKRIFRYLKGQPKLGLWYPKVSLFDMEAYSDSDYAGANLDRKSTTGGYQFLATLLNGRLLKVTTAKHRLLLPSIGENDSCKELASPKQMALGKDESNPLIVDSLLKTIWSSMHHVLAMKHWLFQSKRLLDIYDNPSLTKKVYANMKRVGTSFSRVITPLFENMLVLAAEEVGQAQDDVSIPIEPSTSKPYKKQKSKKHQPKAPMVPSPESSPEHIIPSPSNDPIPDVDKDNLKFQELMDLCTRLSNKVLDLESEVIDITSSFTNKIEKLKVRGRIIADMDEDVEVNLEEARVKAYNLDLQHLEKVLSIQDIDKEEPAEVEEVLKVVTAAKLITKVVTTAEPTTTAAQVPKASAPRRKRGVVIQDYEEITTSVIVHTKLEAELNANINWNDVTEQVKRSERQNNAVMRYQALKRKPLTEAQAKNMMIYLHNMAGSFLERVEEEVTVQEKEIEEEKATPLASKVLVVYYHIHHENNKPYYKIIRVDGTHKLFLSFITLLKNFDKEDLKALWNLVKERFEITEPKNFSDDLLLNILKIMFEKPNIEASV